MTDRMRRTLRDQLLDAEQARAILTIDLGSSSLHGHVTDVGVDYVTLVTEDGEADAALFHIRSVRPVDQAAGYVPKI